jgi:UV DNA damage endonuclease
MAHGIRISMHPDQFILINSPNFTVFERSKKELMYHGEFLDIMELDTSAKIQIHVGGVYNIKEKSIGRFIRRFSTLDAKVKRRLVVENDDRSYNFNDCLSISKRCHIPMLFDVFHHELNSSGQTINEVFESFTKSWKKRDGVPMVDYSSQSPGVQKGRHAQTIDIEHFNHFLSATHPWNFDIMLEIKDKEASALKAIQAAHKDVRFKPNPTHYSNP